MTDLRISLFLVTYSLFCLFFFGFFSEGWALLARYCCNGTAFSIHDDDGFMIVDCCYCHSYIPPSVLLLCFWGYFLKREAGSEKREGVVWCGVELNREDSYTWFSLCVRKSVSDRSIEEEEALKKTYVRVFLRCRVFSMTVK